MTDYNDGKWHGWNGGECPVHEKTLVEVKYADGRELEPSEASMRNAVRWTHETNVHSQRIIAFRVVKEYREPREFWIVLKVGSGKPPEVFGTEPTSVYMAGLPNSWQVIHVREVLE